MKRVSLFILLLAFASLATISCSYADSSPPGIEISIENDYELPGNIDLIETNFTGVTGTIEGRIAVYDCDLKCWPSITETTNIYTLNTESSLYVVREANNINTDYDRHCGQMEIINIPKNQHNENRFETEVLSLFYNSKGERFSARNEVT